MRGKWGTTCAVFAVLTICTGVGVHSQPGSTPAKPADSTPSPAVENRKERLLEALKNLTHPDPDTREKAVVFMGQKGDMSVVKPLSSALADPVLEVREQAERSMWQIWLRSGNPETDRMLYLGMDLMQSGQLKNAIHTFSHVIKRAPDFAEGYNKRATALYLAGQYKESIADCDVTLRLNPFHFGALFGKGLNYVKLNDLPKALQAFQETLKVIPYSDSAKSFIDAIEKRLKPGGKET